MKKLLLALLLAATPALAVVSSTATTVSYTGNGVTTDFLIPFAYASAADISVVVAGVTQVQGVAYTVTGTAFVENTGSVHFPVPPTGAVVVGRTTPSLQLISLPAQGRYTPKVHQNEWDRLTMMIQERPLLSVIAPLPLSLGGSGVSGLPNCGAGVLTSDGTKFLCTTLSGLAPPGTTSVALQAVSPGTPQVGHLNINGTARMGFVYGTTIGNDVANVAFRSPGLAAGGAPFNFDTTGIVAAGQAYMTLSAQGGFMTIYSSPVTGGSPIITPQTTSLTVCSTALSLGTIYPGACYAGDAQVNLVAKAMINLDTGAFVIPNATTFFRVRNAGVTKLSLTGDGTLTITGPVNATGGTFTGPVSGTTGTFSGAVSGTTGTFSGAAALNGGTTIGSSGTAISGSFRGTLAVGTSTLGAGACFTQSITVTSSAVGADCAWTSSVGEADGVLSQCHARAGFCDIKSCNFTGAGIGLPAQTLSCRVFNP